MSAQPRSSRLDLLLGAPLGQAQVYADAQRSPLSASMDNYVKSVIGVDEIMHGITYLSGHGADLRLRDRRSVYMQSSYCVAWIPI